MALVTNEHTFSFLNSILIILQFWGLQVLTGHLAFRAVFVDVLRKNLFSAHSYCWQNLHTLF